RVSAPAVPLTPRLAVMLFGLFIVIALSAGLTFNVLTIALPKIVDERLSNDLPLILVGSIATAVLVCGALAQLTVGRVVEWIPPHAIFAIVTGIGFLGNLWAGHRQRHDHGALYCGCLARARLCGAIFPAVRQRGCRNWHDIAAA